MDYCGESGSQKTNQQFCSCPSVSKRLGPDMKTNNKGFHSLPVRYCDISMDLF